MPAIGFAIGHRGQHVTLTRAEAFERTVYLATAKHPPDDLGIERAAPRSHALDCVHERVHVADALLE